MTHKQLVAAKERWQESNGSAFEGVELHCIEMMHSILIYQHRPNAEEFPFPKDDYYLQDYLKEIGVERAQILWNEQVKDYKQARVGKHPVRDTDGCEFNYCLWADD